MRFVEFLKDVVTVSAALASVGFAVSTYIAWKFRKEIKQAELRRAAVLAQRIRRIRAEKARQESESHDEALAGASH